MKSHKFYYKKIIKPLALLLLAAITVFGMYRFLKDSPYSMLHIWRGRETTLLIAVAMAVINTVFDMACWLWIYSLFGMRVFDATGMKVYLSAFASLMLPINMGDFIRPAIISRLSRGSLADGVKAEVTMLFFNGAGAAVLLVGVLAWWVYPPALLAAIPAAIFLLIVVMKYAGVLSSRLRITLPPGISETNPVWIAIILLQAISWTTAGLTLYFVARGLPGNMGIAQSLFITPICSLLGITSGAPGGVGVSESAFGIGLSIAHIPAAHIALVVFAYRIITFWAYIPIGWIALAAVNRKLPKKDA